MTSLDKKPRRVLDEDSWQLVQILTKQDVVVHVIGKEMNVRVRRCMVYIRKSVGRNMESACL